MQVLLIWEGIPESTKLYLLDGKMADTAVKAHGCYVNMVDGDPDGAAEALNQALEDEGLIPVEDTTPMRLPPVTVVRSGFMM